MVATTAKALSIEEIKKQHPNEWVLLGDPVIEVTKVLSGVVIAHRKEMRELADLRVNWKKDFVHATVIYTGEFPKNRRFLL